PPRPELDPNVADEEAENNFVEPPHSTGNLGVAGHFGFEEQAGIVEFSNDNKGSLRQTLGGLGGDGRDGDDFALETAVEMGASLQGDRVADFDVGNLLFGDGDFGIGRFHGVDLGDEVVLFDGGA